MINHEAPLVRISTPGAVPSSRFAHFRWPALIVVATMLCFTRVLGNEFVNWDDDKMLLNNPAYRGLGLEQIRWMFSTRYMCNYQPLGWLSYGLDYVLWGMWPGGYHLTSVVIHVAAAVGLYWLTMRLIGHATTWPTDDVCAAAGLATLVFALHPLRVESVAWASERRDVLSGLFVILSLAAYVRWGESEGRGGGKWFMVAIVGYAASLLSKATAMGLPIVLLALDWYPLGRWTAGVSVRRRALLFLEKIPFVALGGLAAAIAYVAQRESHTLASVAAHGLVERLVQAGYGLWFYLWKSVVPIGLSPLVPVPARGEFFGVRLAAPIVAALGIVVLVVLARRRFPGGFVAGVAYLVFLLPVLGLTQTGQQLVADRYSYLPSLGLSVLFGGAAVLWMRTATAQRALRSAVFLYLATLGGLTFAQTGVWRDASTLWTHVLARYPKSAVAHVNLANHLAETGRVQSALDHFDEALRLNPALHEAHYGRGTLLLNTGACDAARQSLDQAIRLRPNDAETWNNLGLCHLTSARPDEAIGAFQNAIRFNPRHFGALNNLGQALVQRRRYAEAIHAWRRALALQPNSPGFLETLAWYLATAPDAESRDGADAVRLAARACEQTQYTNPGCLDALAAAYAEVGQFDEAIRAAESAIELLPNPDPHGQADAIRSRLERYQSHQPWREPAP